MSTLKGEHSHYELNTKEDREIGINLYCSFIIYLLKYTTNLHGHLHERDSSLLILEEFSEPGGFFLLNLQSPPRVSAKLIPFAFPPSHPLIRSLPVLNGMMCYDLLKQKCISKLMCPSFGSRIRFSSGESIILAVRA